MITGFKLVTGEEIIADANNMSTGQVRLTVPVQIKLMPPQIQGGPPSLGFAPFPEYAVEGSTLVLEPLHIVYSYTPDPGIVLEYNSMLKAPAQTPVQSQIITG